MADPFFLLTLTGSAIGVALYLARRSPGDTAHPLRTRRQRAIGIPVVLTIAVVTAGATVFVDGGLILEWWLWAAALFGGVTVYTWVVLRIPRWWRVPLVLLLAAPIIPAVEAWRALPHPANYLGLRCTDPVLALRENGDSRNGDPTIALVRLDPPLEENGPMTLRVLPAVSLVADGSHGGWQPAVQVGTADSIQIVVTLERYPSPLWWFPTDDRVSQLSISTPEQSATMSAAPVRYGWLRDVGSTRMVELVQPDRPGRFLQPGVYALEYSCGATDTENV